MSRAIRTEGTQVDILLDTGALAGLEFASPGRTITRSDPGGSFIHDGFVVGQSITTTSAGNAGPLTITAVTATVLTVAETLSQETVDAAVQATIRIGEVKDFNQGGSAASVRQVTHLGSTAVEKRKGLPDGGNMTLTLNRIFSDVGQQTIWAARASREDFGFQVAFVDASTMAFRGFVTEFSTTGGVDSDVEGSVQIDITGEVTITAAAA